MRPLWFLAGAGAGVYVMVRARRAAEVLTPEGFADRVDGLRLGWQLFSDEVRTGMAERESELREKFEVAPDDRAAIESAETRHLTAGRHEEGDGHGQQ